MRQLPYHSNLSLENCSLSLSLSLCVRARNGLDTCWPKPVSAVQFFFFYMNGEAVQLALEIGFTEVDYDDA